jgi:ribosomal-protein-alanine N-acetyltransferase
MSVSHPGTLFETSRTALLLGAAPETQPAPVLLRQPDHKPAHAIALRGFTVAGRSLASCCSCSHVQRLPDAMAPAGPTESDMDTTMEAPPSGHIPSHDIVEDGMAPSSFSLRRLHAERLTEAHLPVLRAMHRNEQLMAMLGGIRSDSETDAYLARNLAHWSEHGFGIWMLRDATTDHIIGRAGLREVNIEGATEVELAYALFPEFWGRGLATDAARACVTIGRDWLGLPSLVGLTLPANVASQRVLRKAALLREREVIHAGREHVLYRSD